MKRTLLAPLAALAIGALAGCGSDEPAWDDARQYEHDDVLELRDAFDVGPVRVAESTSDGLPCAEVTVADVATGCIPVGAGEFGYSSRALRVDDVRYVDLRTSEAAREFVVWSSASPSGRSIEPIVAAGNAILVWIMEPGEEPWGVQAIGSDGELGFAKSFVGLPPG